MILWRAIIEANLFGRWESNFKNGTSPGGKNGKKWQKMAKRKKKWQTIWRKITIIQSNKADKVD